MDLYGLFESDGQVGDAITGNGSVVRPLAAVLALLAVVLGSFQGHGNRSPRREEPSPSNQPAPPSQPPRWHRDREEAKQFALDRQATVAAGRLMDTPGDDLLTWAQLSGPATVVLTSTDVARTFTKITQENLADARRALEVLKAAHLAGISEDDLEPFAAVVAIEIENFRAAYLHSRRALYLGKMPRGVLLRINGQALLALERPKDALDTLSEALRHDDQDPQTCVLLAAAYQQAGNVPYADALLRRAVHLDPGIVELFEDPVAESASETQPTT